MLLEALASGGGSDWYYTVLVKAPLNANVTVDDGDEEVTAVGAGVDTLIGIPVHNPSSAYTVSVEMDGFTAPTQTVNTPATSGGISTELTFNFATINMTYDDEFRGQTATITDGTHTQTATLPAAPSNLFTVHVPYTGNWRISAEDSVGHQLFYTSPDPIPITSLTQTSNVDMFVIPNGETVLPVNDIETWLACADIKNTGYTTLAEVLADEDVLFKVLTDDNANKYLKRSTKFAKRVEVPILSADSDKIYKAGQTFVNGYEAWKAFDGNDSTAAAVQQSNTVAYLGYIFDDAEEIVKVTVSAGTGSNTQHVIEYSDDGTDWTLCSDTATTTAEKQLATLNINSGTGSHRYWRMKRTTASATSGVCYSLQFYGKDKITDSELAMQIIGADDFASDILLSDATWREAIVESEYVESVTNGRNPIMTSDTTPSGSCSASMSIYDGHAWNAFDDDISTYCQLRSGTAVGGEYVEYDFASPFRPLLAKAYLMTTQANLYVKAYDEDTTTWVTIGTLKPGSSHDIQSAEMDSSKLNKTYAKYRFEFATSSSISPKFWVCQIFGREAGGVQTLLKAAGISRPYTTIDELLADHVTLQKVISSHDAIDYLVTAKSFIDAITSDATAMRYIGKRNYAADTLLADEDWLEGIVYSDYVDSVMVKTPAMTSNTTPSGTVTAGNYYDTNYPYLCVGNESNVGYWQSQPGGNHWIQYEFAEAFEPIYVRYGLSHNYYADQATVTGQLKGYDETAGQWDDLTVMDSTGKSKQITHRIDTNGKKYKKYQIYSTVDYTMSTNITAWFIYGREDVDESKIDVYGAAGATVQFEHNGSWENLTTLDATTDKGHAVIDVTDLPTGVSKLLFKTDVAKDPDDLTADYTKEIDIFDDMIEIAVMPDNVIYWYGNNQPTNLGNGLKQGCKASNTGEWQYSTASASCESQGNNMLSTEFIKTRLYKKANVITDVTHRSYGTSLLTSNNSTITDDCYNYAIDRLVIWRNANNEKISLEITKDDDARVNYGINSGTIADATTLRALWMSRPNPLANFFSAAKDTVYYLENGVQVVVAKTDEFGGAVVDFNSIPANTTLYSSVAKDPTDATLQTAFSKQFVPSGGKFYLMPEDGDKMLYWYGYVGKNLEDVSTANGWEAESGYSVVSPVYNDNYILISAPSSSQDCGVGNKKEFVGSYKVKAIAQGVTIAGGNYMYICGHPSKTLRNNDPTYTSVSNTSIEVYEYVPSAATYNSYVATYNANGRSGKLYAMWVEE